MTSTGTEQQKPAYSPAVGLAHTSPSSASPVRSSPFRGSGLGLAEEAVELVRRAGLATLALYYIGSLPFVLGLITFWASMRQSAYAHQTLPESAFCLALLFVWMKTWQSRYCRGLLAQLREEPLPPWRLGLMLRCASRQALLHASGFVILPLAVLITIPFGWVYAAYQNATVLDDGYDRSLRALVRDAVRQAQLWPRQNHITIWLFSPFLLLLVAAFFLGLLPVIQGVSPHYLAHMGEAVGILLILALMPLNPLGVVIAANIAMGILLVATLFHSLLGVETVLTQAPFTVFNSTFAAIVCGLAYLCMDPVLKAAYVLRCFHGDALEDGLDLRLALRKAAGRAACLCLLFAALACASPAFAAASASVAPDGGSTTVPSPNPGLTPRANEKVAAPGNARIDAAQLNSALDRELRRARYAWRMPREQLEAHEKGIIARTLSRISQSIEHALSYLREMLRRWLEPTLDDREHSWRDLRAIAFRLRLLFLCLSAFLSAVLVLLLIRLWRRRRRIEARPREVFTPVLPDIEDEATHADALPEEGWLSMANAFLEKGQYRLAIRALFLATLACLAGHGLIQIAHFKSNLDYARELGRRPHAHAKPLPLFAQSTRIYEAVWYGDHDASPAALRDTLLDNLRMLGNDAQE